MSAQTNNTTSRPPMDTATADLVAYPEWDDTGHEPEPSDPVKDIMAFFLKLIIETAPLVTRNIPPSTTPLPRLIVSTVANAAARQIDEMFPVPENDALKVFWYPLWCTFLKIVHKIP